VTDYHNPAWTEESRFRGALDDVIIIPLVFVALATSKILRFILSILMRLLDYAFPLAMQIVWLPLFPIKHLRLVQFDGRTWQPIGEVLETAFSNAQK
jgi:hypothetical protein